jgi:hypothetical protein
VQSSRRRRVSNGGEADPEDAVLEVRHELCHGLDRQARLAGASGARERDQATAVAEQRNHICDLALPADKGRRRPRQIRVRDGLERREALRPELVDPDWLVEILHAVLPEISEFEVDERLRAF